MYLYLGGAVSVKKKDIIGIFDIDNVNTQKTTKEFLRNAEKNGRLLLAGEDLPKSFLLTRKKGNGKKESVILCRLSARSIYGRARRNEAYE